MASKSSSLDIHASCVLETALELVACSVNLLIPIITCDTDSLRLSLPSYIILSHKLIELSGIQLSRRELSQKELSRIDTSSNYVLSGKIRRYNVTAVMTIKEPQNIAKVPFRGNNY
jgi:hypothetical protein